MTTEQRDRTAAFERRVQAHLDVLYPTEDTAALATDAIAAIGIVDGSPSTEVERWSQRDSVLITYGDSLVDGERSPLEVLREVVAKLLSPAISVVHVLPFYPYSSDRGFSVVDYTSVDPALGSWDDVDGLCHHVDLMADLVCNHASSQSAWFRQFLADEEPGRRYFTTADADADVSSVVRPRQAPLLHQYETAGGPRHAWCTFSADQVDLDYRNPAVLLEILGVIDLYVRHGARFIRLDAIAYLWKELGTSCIHLPETHEMIRLWHTLLEVRAPGVSLITETNVPNIENLSYFGNRDEAHLIYNFSLPPLVVDAMLRGRSDRLSQWMMSMPPAPPGCTYLNFLASHDGIGVRPAEGLLNDDEIGDLVTVTEARGGLYGTYDAPGGPRPYELNISLWDLFSAPIGPEVETETDPRPDDGLRVERFLCAHAIMLGVEGVPAIYVNSLFARQNDRAAADASGVRRDISRARITLDEAQAIAAAPDHGPGKAMAELLRLLEIRSGQQAFHPNATQFTLQLGPEIFAFWRQSVDRTQSVFAIHNCSATDQAIPLHRLNLIVTDSWHDLITGESMPNDATEINLTPYQTVWLTNIG